MTPLRGQDTTPETIDGLLLACHTRIRSYLAGLRRLLIQPDLGDPDVARAAAQAWRYFSEALPLHAADEDHSVGPRLLVLEPGFGPQIEALHQEHERIEAGLGPLLAALAALRDGRPMSHAELREAVEPFATLLLQHIEDEERWLIPATHGFSAEVQAVLVRELRQRRSVD